MPKTVLLVEDYADTRDFMRMMLEAFGYTVVEAETGLEAIEQAAAAHPNLIFMDVSLPELDGLSATRRIRQAPESADTPIIAVTAYASQITAEALAAGCNSVVSKPVNIEALEVVLKEYLVS